MRALPTSNETLARIHKGLRMVSVPLPHLAGLAGAVRVDIDDRVPTMGVFASGRMIANREFVARLKDNELVFVLAHELLHLALRTHDRAKGSSTLEFNYAHDYIINDILRTELGTPIPAGGLDLEGAREKSAEEIVLSFRKGGQQMQSQTRVWEGRAVAASKVFRGGRPGAGSRSDQSGADDGEMAGDVLGDKLEREWFADDAKAQAENAKRIEELAAKGLALAKALAALKGRGAEAGASQQVVSALRGLYRTPWQMALQKWLESVAPGERTFMRPSRRSQDRSDIVLPGRKRESWMLNVLLDTSGSMTGEIPRALGAIAEFCEAMGVECVRVVQCDTEITADAVVTPDELATFEVNGFGGSDLTPAMLAFADDPRVTAAVIVTDGDIEYPREEMPYRVLWVLPARGGFCPPYGAVVGMDGEP
ncbi:MAG: VWA-like domain-containing protein [Xanthobacteraceae bacterium]